MADDAQPEKQSGGNNDRRRRLDSVRRRLDFEAENASCSSPIDENNLANEEAVHEFFKKQAEDAVARWNFDFTNDMPLEGDWEWEKVESANQLDYKELTTERKLKKDEENRNI